MPDCGSGWLSHPKSCKGSCCGKLFKLNLPGREGHASVKRTRKIASWASGELSAPLQVRSVPVRKDDEVTVVRGTYKVGLHAGKQLVGCQWGRSPFTLTQLSDAAALSCKQAIYVTHARLMAEAARWGGMRHE